MYKVAIIDDEALFRQHLKTVIRWSDFEFEITFEARDGEDALEKALNNKIDLFLVDLTMPFMGGIEFVKKIKEKKIGGKVVFITGHGEFNYAKEAIKLGVADYILKPFSSDELISTVNKIKEELDSANKGIFSNINVIEDSNIHYPKSYYIEFIMELYAGNKSGVSKRLDDVFSNFNDSNNNGCLFGISASFLSLGLAFLSEYNISIEQCFKEKINPYNDLKNCRSTVEVKIYVKRFFNNIFNIMDVRKWSKAQKLSYEAKEFIDKNYSRSDLRLEDICKYTLVNESYLRAVFKKEIGITVNDYITQVRLSKAKELIKKGEYKFSYICESVGYNDSSYFSKCFKKHFGITPKEYEISLK